MDVNQLSPPDNFETTPTLSTPTSTLTLPPSTTTTIFSFPGRRRHRVQAIDSLASGRFNKSPARPPRADSPPPPLSPLVVKDPVQEFDWCPRYLAAAWMPYGAPLPPNAYLDVSVVILPRRERCDGPAPPPGTGAAGPPSLGPTPSASPVTVAMTSATTTPAATPMWAHAVDFCDAPSSVTQGSAPLQSPPSSVTQGSTPKRPPSFKPILRSRSLSVADVCNPEAAHQIHLVLAAPARVAEPRHPRRTLKKKDSRRQHRRLQQLLEFSDAPAAPPRRKLKRKQESSRDRAPKPAAAAAAAADRGFLDLEAELSGSDNGAGSHDDDADSDDSAGSLVDWIAETQMEPDTPTSRLALYRMAHPPESPMDDDEAGPLQLLSFLLRGRARLPPMTPRTPGARTNDTYDSQDPFLAPSDEPEPASTSTVQVSLDALEAQFDRDYRRRKRRRRERERGEDEDDDEADEEVGSTDEATTPPIRLRPLNRTVVELLSDDDD
ncbi:hypothetical protein AMAG_17829 [Allomyces macrogynus ATCC 38327]|uniref:Uncharacterized protein n=1 Tax=Allomyces macrogynus (strain ATCC 38327) TaxID=578462 RepID=A0A0L0S055_ALLM3|nr:hypothetical protein AMAG_17829 [Allomyces macrogynus ATCC 38327]|eukprot:KNE55795.1 hypothetical protein AMAG_17829 [Allomyces macrogynus ATCC 38327]